MRSVSRRDIVAGGLVVIATAAAGWCKATPGQSASPINSRAAFAPAAAAPLHTFTGAGWHLISSPFTIDRTFADLSVVTFAYIPAIGNYVVTPTSPADTFHLGQGYWTYVRGASLDISAIGTPADNTTPFSIPLARGWNIVGNPFIAAEALSSIKVVGPAGSTTDYATAVRSSMVSPLFVFDNTAQNYTLLSQGTDQLNPWDGAWVYAQQGVTALIFNPGPGTGGATVTIE